MLSERSSNILRYIVDMYVSSAHPVPSQAVARGFPIALSAATVRNEMMRLEEGGYLSQPHTSAGRVPLDKGYRYYVETLVAPREPPEAARREIQDQFVRAGRDLEEWSRLAANILARRVRNMAVVTTARLEQARLLWLELTRMQPAAVLLIAGLDAGRVRQQLLAGDGPEAQDDLTSLAQRLTAEAGGMNARQLRQKAATAADFEREVLGTAAQVVAGEDETDYASAVTQGLREVLSQPEFEDSQKIIHFLDVFDERNLARVIPLQDLPRGVVTVIIGGEHPQTDMREFSLVVMPYGGASGLSGAVSVAGPTRLNYGSAISMVRYMAGVMDELIATHFA